MSRRCLILFMSLTLSLAACTARDDGEVAPSLPGTDDETSVSDTDLYDIAGIAGDRQVEEGLAEPGYGAELENVLLQDSSQANAAEDNFAAVLQGNAPFFYVSDGNTEEMNITDVPSIFSPDDPLMMIWEYSVVDLEGDGKEEMILHIVGAAGDMGGRLILHCIGDEIYGYSSDNRMLVDLKADGTFSYSDPTGVNEGGIGVIAEFSENGYTIDKISYGTGTYEGWNTFVVERQPATEEEYLNAVARQSEKMDAEWYDYQ